MIWFVTNILKEVLENNQISNKGKSNIHTINSVTLQHYL